MGNESPFDPKYELKWTQPPGDDLMHWPIKPSKTNSVPCSTSLTTTHKYSLEYSCTATLPEYFDFFGSLFTTAMVNWAKWLQPAAPWKTQYPQTSSGHSAAKEKSIIKDRESRTRDRYDNTNTSTKDKQEIPGKSGARHFISYQVRACHSQQHKETVKDGCTHHSLEGRQGCTWPIWTKKQVLRHFLNTKLPNSFRNFFQDTSFNIWKGKTYL
jgi:hypothetical protein